MSSIVVPSNDFTMRRNPLLRPLVIVTWPNWNHPAGLASPDVTTCDCVVPACAAPDTANAPWLRVQPASNSVHRHAACHRFRGIISLNWSSHELTDTTA